MRLLIFIVWLCPTGIVLAQSPEKQAMELTASAEQVMLEKPDSACTLAEQALKLAQDARYTRGALQALFVLSKANQIAGRAPLIRQWAEQGLKLARQHADTGYEARFLAQIGSYHAIVAQTDSATWYFNESSVKFLQAGDSLGHYKSVQNKASVLMRAGQLQQALENFMSAYRFFVRQDDPLLQAPVAANIALVYDEMKNADSAAVFFQALEQNIGLLSDYHQFSSRINLAIFNEKQGRLQAAITHYDEAARLARKLGNKRQMIALAANKGILENKLNHPKAAEKLFNEALALIGEDSLYLDLKQITLQDLSEVYAGRGQWEKAYHTFKESAELGTKLTGIERNEAIAEMEAKYDRALDQKQIAEQQLAIDREQSRRRLLLLFLSATVLVAAVFFFFLWKTRRQKRTIESQHETLRLLYGDLQHRTKNYLQTVGAMLNLHSAQTTDADARRLLSEEQRRVETIKLLEQKLMQEQRPSSRVKIHEYLEAILDNLSRALGANNPLQIVKDLQPLEMDMEQAMSIGLIVNELVMNAGKYAGGKGVSPVVSVSLHHTDRLRLVVEDNGKGLPAGFNPEAGNSFGLRLALLFAQRLGGTLSWKNNPGARFEFMV